jgi:hypothetical protein
VSLEGRLIQIPPGPNGGRTSPPASRCTSSSMAAWAFAIRTSGSCGAEAASLHASGRGASEGRSDLNDRRRPPSSRSKLPRLHLVPSSQPPIPGAAGTRPTSASQRGQNH